MEKYDIVRRIGSGSFGTAWLAKDTRSGNKCVIKKVPLTGLSSIEYQNALREGDLLASISHPSVCLLHTSFVDPATNELCLVSEFCARGDVAKVLEGRVPMPEPAVLELAAQIGLALMWLHRKRMLHRDIKPANVFIRENGEFSLGDFGIARTLLNTMAMAKTVVGTPYCEFAGFQFDLCISPSPPFPRSVQFSSTFLLQVCNNFFFLFHHLLFKSPPPFDPLLKPFFF